MSKRSFTETEIFGKKVSFISIVALFSCFQTWFYQMRRLYP